MPTILDLLMALNRGDLPPLPGPAPSAPIPYAPTNLGPLSDETTAAFAAQNPEPVPPRFIQPSAPDQEFVNQYAGPEPTRPVIPQASTLQKIVAVLSGIGEGPGYGMVLREERERPIKEYNAAAERYQGRRAQGLEAAERRAEREAAQANRAAEIQYDRDFKLWLKKNDVREGAAAQQAAQAFELLKEARKNAETERKERVLLRRQISLQIDDRIKAYRDQGAGDHSEELARSDFRMALGELGEKVPPLSAAAAKANTLVQAKIQRALRLAQGGGGTGGGVDKQTAKLVEEFNNVRQNLITATARGDAKGQKEHRMRLSQLVKRLAGRPGVEAGYGGGQWPYLKVNGVLQGVEEAAPTQAAPQSQIADPLGIR